MAVQLNEMAQIMTDTVEHAWDTHSDEELEEHLRKKLRAMGLSVHAVLVYCEEHRRQEVYLTMSTRRRRCVAVKDIAAALTKLMKKAMMPARDSRAFVGGERVTVLFVERTNFQVLYGVEKAVKGKERVSGDNFSLRYCREGQFIGALSDGMGSGLTAYRGERAGDRSAGTVSGGWIFQGDGGADDQFRADSALRRAGIFHHRHCVSGSVYRGVRFPEGRGFHPRLSGGKTGWRRSRPQACRQESSTSWSRTVPERSFTTETW